MDVLSAPYSIDRYPRLFNLSVRKYSARDLLFLIAQLANPFPARAASIEALRESKLVALLLLLLY